jgi:hypothetical protein
VTWQRAHAAVDRREFLISLVSVIQLAILGLSPVALVLTLVRAGRRVSGAVWRVTETRPVARAVVVAVTSATATGLFLSWWMNGAYRPVRAGERGTLSSRILDAQAAIGSWLHHRRSGPTSAHPRPSRSTSLRQRSRPHLRLPAARPTRHGGATTSGAGQAQVKDGATRPRATTASQDPGLTTTSPETNAGVSTSAPETTTSTTTTTPTITSPPTTTTTPSTTTPTTGGTTTATTGATTTAP